MKLEYRVFKDRVLIFRAAYTAPDVEDLEGTRAIEAAAVLAFQQQHPDIDLRDPSIFTVWWNPDAPLSS